MTPSQFFFNGKPKHIWDDFAHDYLAAPSQRQLKAQSKIAFTSMYQALAGHPAIYLMCAISSGARAHEKTLAYGHNTTDRLDETVGGDVFMNDVVLHNNRDNYLLARHCQALLPDKVIIAPTIFEGCVRELKGNPVLSGGRKWQAENFMSLWFPVIDTFCTMNMVNGDWRNSSNSFHEMFRCLLIQAGMVPHRPKADMEAIYADGSPASLLDRSLCVANHLLRYVPRGVHASKPATTLLRMFRLNEMLTRASVNREMGGLIDPSRLHPQLLHRDPAEVEGMAWLEAKMRPFIRKHCGPLIISQEGLNPVYGRAGDSKRFDADKIGQLLEEIRVPPKNDMAPYLAVPAGSSPRLFDPHQPTAGSRWHSAQFEGRHYERLGERERALLPFIIGAVETAMNPLASPLTHFIAADLKRGELGLALALREGVKDLAELPGKVGKTFGSLAKKDAAELCAKAVEEERGTPQQHLTLSPLAVAAIDETVLRHPEAVAAPGVARHRPYGLGPLGRLTLMMKLLERNGGIVRFEPKWEESEDLAQLMVRATLVQLGQVERPGTEANSLTVTNWQRQEIPLPVRIAALGSVVERYQNAGLPAPVEIAKGAAQLLEVADMFTSPRYAAGRLHVLPVKATGLFGDPKGYEALRASLRPRLEQECLSWSESDLNDLSPDYRKAWIAARGSERARQQREVTSDIRVYK